MLIQINNRTWIETNHIVRLYLSPVDEYKVDLSNNTTQNITKDQFYALIVGKLKSADTIPVLLSKGTPCSEPCT